MLDYKNIIIKHYALSLSGSEIARQLGASKSGVNDFLRAFDKCESLSYPLPPGITNYGIAELVYGSIPGSGGRNENIEYPDYEADAKLMATRKNIRKYLLRHPQLLSVFILFPENFFVNGQEQQEKASGLQIRSICRIIIKDLLSGMAPTLSKKPSLLERIRKPLSALFLNQGCMKSKPTECVLVS